MQVAAGIRWPGFTHFFGQMSVKSTSFWALSLKKDAKKGTVAGFKGIKWPGLTHIF